MRLAIYVCATPDCPFNGIPYEVAVNTNRNPYVKEAVRCACGNARVPADDKSAVSLRPASGTGNLVDLPPLDPPVVPTPVLTPDDPNSLAATKNQETANYDVLAVRLAQALQTLENAWANWDTLTAAQKDSIAKLNTRVNAALIRLTLRRLDAS